MRPTPTITADEVKALRDAGRKVAEQPDGIILLDGFRKFQIVDDPNHIEHRPVGEQPQDANDVEGLSGGNELTGFDFDGVNNGRNGLTDFDTGDTGQSRGGNDLIDFK